MPQFKLRSDIPFLRPIRTRERRSSQDSVTSQDLDSPFILDFIPDSSSPALCSGSQGHSEGAIVSGYISIKSTTSIKINTLITNLLLTERILDSAESTCKNCSSYDTIISGQQLIDASNCRELPEGDHVYPITLHVNGTFPATFSDSSRKVEYIIEIIAETEEYGLKKATKPVVLSRLCPWQIHDKRVRSNTELFKIQLKIPQYTSRNDKFTAELIIEDKERQNTSSLSFTKWEIVTVEWQVTECIQGIRLPCPEHSDSFRSAHKRLLKESNLAITSGCININPEVHKPETYDGRRRFVLPFHCKTPDKATYDVKTPKGYKVWHVLACKVLYSIEQVDDYASCRVPAMHNVPICSDRFMQIRSIINVCEANADGEITSWDEMIAPAYTQLPPSPPRYEDCGDLLSRSNTMESVMA